MLSLAEKHITFSLTELGGKWEVYSFGIFSWLQKQTETMKVILDNAVDYYTIIKLYFMKVTGCILHHVYSDLLSLES